jgi:cold shock CspA family protein
VSGDEGPISSAMRVSLYVPDRMYGFCEDDEGGRVFFHLEAFAGGLPDGLGRPPPPILGEEVVAEYLPGELPDGKAPKALRVTRSNAPPFVRGVVESFNPERGWGFARGEDNTSYYLHRSEIEHRRIPVLGQEVRFYAGFQRGRPRACHVQVGRIVG